MGKFAISMAMFNSYVELPDGIWICCWILLETDGFGFFSRFYLDGMGFTRLGVPICLRVVIGIAVSRISLGAHV